MAPDSTTRSRRGWVAAAAAVALLSACSSSGKAAPTPTAATTPPTTTPPAASSSAGTSPAATSAAPTAATTTTAGNPSPSIAGAPSVAALIAAGNAALKPTAPVSTQTLPDGTVAASSFREAIIGGLPKGQASYTIDYNPADKSVAAVSCAYPSGAGTLDPTLKLCTDLTYDGSDAATAEAWVRQAIATIPATDSTTRRTDRNLNGLFWVVYREAVTTDIVIVTVSAKPISV